jgi:hypothetical protein
MIFDDPENCLLVPKGPYLQEHQAFPFTPQKSVKSHLVTIGMINGINSQFQPRAEILQNKKYFIVIYF